MAAGGCARRSLSGGLPLDWRTAELSRTLGRVQEVYEPHATLTFQMSRIGRYRRVRRAITGVTDGYDKPCRYSFDFFFPCGKFLSVLK